MPTCMQCVKLKIYLGLLTINLSLDKVPGSHIISQEMLPSIGEFTNLIDQTADGVQMKVSIALRHGP